MSISELSLVVSILGFALGMLSASDKLLLLWVTIRKSSRSRIDRFHASLAARAHVLINSPSLLISFIFDRVVILVVILVIEFALIKLVGETDSLFIHYLLLTFLAFLSVIGGRLLYGLGFMTGFCDSEIKNLVNEKLKDKN